MNTDLDAGCVLVIHHKSHFSERCSRELAAELKDLFTHE